MRKPSTRRSTTTVTAPPKEVVKAPAPMKIARQGVSWAVEQDGKVLYQGALDMARRFIKEHK